VANWFKANRLATPFFRKSHQNWACSGSSSGGIGVAGAPWMTKLRSH